MRVCRKPKYGIYEQRLSTVCTDNLHRNYAENEIMRFMIVNGLHLSS